MLDTIQHIVENDMNATQGLICFGSLFISLAWCVWQERRAKRAVLAIAKREANTYYKAACIEMDEIGQRVAEHDRILDLGQIDPDQEAIDAAIAEADAEDAKAIAM